MINTFSEMKINKLNNYSSDDRESHLDLLLCMRDHLKEVRNCKVINRESVAVQQRLVVIDCRLRNCRRSKKTRMDPKIKWWKLKKEELRVWFKERVLEAVMLHEDVQEWWTKNSKVQERVKINKEAKKKADLSGHEQDKENYKQARKEERRAVAKAKAETLNKVYKEMEKPEGEKKILRNAKAQDAASKNLTQIRQIKDSNVNPCKIFSNMREQRAIQDDMDLILHRSTGAKAFLSENS
ncbi:uncharacterized protein [Palaemon carinicauda]|uniref:uncharacterized protein n=1 Tax=Palaemon carinicauda TaxID=392227 RepID=UPI0035B58560